MQPIIGIDNTGDVVPTGVIGQAALVQQQQQALSGGNGLQIPTSMQQMKGQATTLLKKISPAPPPPPQSAPKPGNIQSGPMQLGGGSGDNQDTSVVIGGKNRIFNSFF